jgi:hypothetical protein
MQKPLGLYSRLRQDLLKAAKHHRRAVLHPAFIGDLHARELVVCQRQLGALRQAYHRTQEAIAWETYLSAREDARSAYRTPQILEADEGVPRSFFTDRRSQRTMPHCAL